MESVAEEVDSFGIGMTIVEPGGARRSPSSCPSTIKPPLIASCPRTDWLPVTRREWPRALLRASTWSLRLRMVLGSQALEGTLTTLRKRIASFEEQTALAASTDFPPGA